MKRLLFALSLLWSIPAFAIHDVGGSGGGGTSGNFINNQATLQSGATFYVSSGTVESSVLNKTALNIRYRSDDAFTYSPAGLVIENTELAGVNSGVEFRSQGSFDGSISADNSGKMTFRYSNAGTPAVFSQFNPGASLWSFNIPLTLQLSAGSLVNLSGLSELRFGDSLGNYIGFKSSNTLGASSYEYTLPRVDGSSGQFLKTDGSGNLSFGTASGGGGGYNVEPATVTFQLNKGVTTSTLTVTGSTVSINGVQYTHWPTSVGLAATSSGVFVVNGSSQVSIQPAITDPAETNVSNTFTSSSSNTFISSTVFSGPIMLGGSAGTSTQVLQSNGNGAAPSWATATGGGGAQDFDLKDSTGSFNRLINYSTNPLVNVSSISFSGTYDASGNTWAIRPSTTSHVPGGSAGSITFTGASSHTVEGMQFWAVAKSTFTGRFVLSVNNSSSNSSGYKFSMTGPASPVFFTMTGGGSGASATTVNFSQQATALNTLTGNFIGTYTSNAAWFEFEFTLITGATAGYVNVQIVPSSGAGNNFINSESYITAFMD